MEKCKYCVEYNGDHFEEEWERYDYYSCELKNIQDGKKNGGYDSKANQVDEDECKYPLCDTCCFKEQINVEEVSEEVL